MKDKNKFLEFLYHIVLDLVGGFLFATGVRVFIVPNQVAQGGATGLAILLNYLTGLPIGMLGFVFNIPLLLIGYKVLGKKFVFKTVRTAFILSVVMDSFTIFNVPTYHGMQLLAAIFGGVLVGTGLGTAFLHGSTTGGMDIVARLVQIKFQHFPIGRVLLMMDFMVLTLSVFVFKNIESGLVGVVGIYASSKVVDMIVYGVDRGKLIQVFSPSATEMSRRIISDVHRGATLVKTIGAFTGEERVMLMCAAKCSQYPAIKKIIKELDPHAFIIVSDANEVLGQGFRSIEQQSNNERQTSKV